MYDWAAYTMGRAFCKAGKEGGKVECRMSNGEDQIFSIPINVLPVPDFDYFDHEPIIEEVIKGAGNHRPGRGNCERCRRA